MNKILKIKEYITNKQCGVYYIDLEDKEKLYNLLDKLEEDGTLSKNKIAYTCTVVRKENYISLLLYTQLNFYK